MTALELVIPLTVRVFHERLSVCVGFFPFFCFDGGLCDLIVSFPVHCLSFYFV